MNDSSLSGNAGPVRASGPDCADSPDCVDGAKFSYLGAAHLDSVLELELLTTSRPWSKEQYVKALDAGLCALAGYTSESGLVAYAAIALSQAAEELEIYNIAVRPDARRRGLATGLITRLMDEAAGLGLKRAVLEVREGNRAARALYASLGFRECGTRPGYYTDPDEDAVICERLL